MTEAYIPTPRQKRTEQLLDQALDHRRKAVEELTFIRELVGRSKGRTLDVDVLLDAMLVTSIQQQSAMLKLSQAVENMAGAPCFGGPGTPVAEGDS
jgi:hypothetical protein